MTRFTIAKSLLVPLFCSAVSSEDSLEKGWDTEDIEIPDEDILTTDTSTAKMLMDEAKAGNVEELQPPCKVCITKTG